MDFPEKITQVQVSAFGSDSGMLKQPAHFQFDYLHNNPVSLTMDYQLKSYNYGALHPVFAQNLPEGYVRRYISEKLRRYANINDMYLLALQQDKGLGHLAFKSLIRTGDIEQLSLTEILNWQGDKSLFAELLDRFYLNGLASGVQPKVLVSARNDTEATTKKVSPKERRTHQHENYIVKTFDEEFPLLTVNEFVCMEAARTCDLAPTRCWLSTDSNTFVTERFDKQQHNTLAIEDFTVLMGKTGDQKYQSSYEMLLKATRLFTDSADQLTRMYQYIVFNCLIGNGDAHLKNFAIQYEPDRQNIHLTPPYDITHTLIYETIDDKMALKMSGAKAFPEKSTLLKLARQFDIKDPELIIERYADQITDFVKNSAEITRFKGLRGSIETSVHKGITNTASVATYRHDKKRKYPRS